MGDARIDSATLLGPHFLPPYLVALRCSQALGGSLGPDNIVEWQLDEVELQGVRGGRMNEKPGQESFDGMDGMNGR